MARVPLFCVKTCKASRAMGSASQRQVIHNKKESVANRSKLSLAQSSADQHETECSSLQEDQKALSAQLARAEAQLTVAQTNLR